MSENERQSQINAVINETLQATVYLLSLPVKKVKYVNIWHSYGEKGIVSCTFFDLEYDTIRDAILTCSQKLT